MSSKNSTINKQTRNRIGATTCTPVSTCNAAQSSNATKSSNAAKSSNDAVASTGTNASAHNYASAEIISGYLNFLIDAIAAMAFKVDELIAIVSKKIFMLLPEKMREKIKSWNEKYKSYRNRLMRIDENSSSPGVRAADEIGDVPGWVLVVLMTTGLVTALWTIAAPRLSQILKNSLDSMNSIR
jgi:hypothetical protein